MAFSYRIFNAPSPFTIDRAAEMGFTHAIVHSAGNENQQASLPGGPDSDLTPLYFEDYPKVAEVRHGQCAGWIEPLRHRVQALCDRAVSQGMEVVFHMYEPMLPEVFHREYPELVRHWRRPTQAGVVEVPNLLDPDNPATWDLFRHKYAEWARTFPDVSMVVLTTWDLLGVPWCVAEADMPIHQRLARMVEAVREGLDSVRSGVTVCFRLWGRNWPREVYLDGHRLIAETTGVENASDLMEPVARPYNDPQKVLPKLFDALPADVPIMFKSTPMDITGDDVPLTSVLGTYPENREQILEISYEIYHRKPWPWCKLGHIRKGLEAAEEHDLAGIVALPVCMGTVEIDDDPEQGHLGRMNTALLERLLSGDRCSNEQLVADWLEKEYQSPQPVDIARLLLEADGLANRGIQWGRGVPNRMPFASLHTTSLFWMFDGFTEPTFPYDMANPTRELLDDMIRMKHEACDRAMQALHTIHALRAATDERLYDELVEQWTRFADCILLCRDWHCHLLMQHGMNHGCYPSDRRTLAECDRYAQTFIRNLSRLHDTPAGQYVRSRMSFPDEFPVP